MKLNKKDNQVKYKLTIDSNDIESTKSVKLLGIIIMTVYDLINTYEICVPSRNPVERFRSTLEIYYNT